RVESTGWGPPGAEVGADEKKSPSREGWVADRPWTDESGRHPTREPPSYPGVRVAFCELRHNFRRPHTQRSRGMPPGFLSTRSRSSQGPTTSRALLSGARLVRFVLPAIGEPERSGHRGSLRPALARRAAGWRTPRRPR